MDVFSQKEDGVFWLPSLPPALRRDFVNGQHELEEALQYVSPVSSYILKSDYGFKTDLENCEPIFKCYQDNRIKTVIFLWC